MSPAASISQSSQLVGLLGKTVLVTGGASGIGLAVCQLLAAVGAQVILTDVNQAQGFEAVNGISDAGGCARFLNLDVGNGPEWSAALADVQSREGRLHGLVNNAGLVRYGSVTRTSWDDWALLRRTMLDGMFLGVKTAAPIIAQHGGAIVNIASIHAFYGSAHQAAYAAVKAAARNFSRSAALEWADRGVRINTLLPGPTATPIVANMPEADRIELGPLDEFAERFRRAVPLGRLATANDIAQGALYLLSDASGFMVGADLVLDGGVTA